MRIKYISIEKEKRKKKACKTPVDSQALNPGHYPKYVLDSTKSRGVNE